MDLQIQKKYSRKVGAYPVCLVDLKIKKESQKDKKEEHTDDRWTEKETQVSCTVSFERSDRQREGQMDG